MCPITSPLPPSHHGPAATTSELRPSTPMLAEDCRPYHGGSIHTLSLSLSLSVISCFSSSLGAGPATPSAGGAGRAGQSVRPSQPLIGEVCLSERGLQPAVVIHPRFELNTIQHFLCEDLQNTKINEMKCGKWLYWLLKSRATNTNT